jgi:hypothetical protein
MRRDIFVDALNELLKPSALVLAQTFPSVFSKLSRPHSPHEVVAFQVLRSEDLSEPTLARLPQVIHLP